MEATVCTKTTDRRMFQSMMKSLKLMSCNVIIALLWGCSTVPLAYFTDVQIMSDDGGANYYLISKLYRENGSNPQVLISGASGFVGGFCVGSDMI